MKTTRAISPFISVLLVLLILSGSTGITYVRHVCQSCGVEEILPLATADPACDENCCSDEPSCCHSHSTGEAVFSDDCCTSETERLSTGETVRTVVQPEVMSIYLAAVTVSTLQIRHSMTGRLALAGAFDPFASDLTMLHCQIRS